MKLAHNIPTNEFWQYASDDEWLAARDMLRDIAIEHEKFKSALGDPEGINALIEDRD